MGRDGWRTQTAQNRQPAALVLLDQRLTPAVASKRIKELETKLGTRLLNRTTRKLVPTEAGRVFYEHARSVVAALEDAEASLAGFEGRFGDHHSIRKTRGSTLFINPLMAIYWCYQLQAVVDRLLYKDVLARTMSWSEVIRVMDATRRLSEGTRRWAPIPF